MNDVLKAKLEQVADDELMLQAIKTVVYDRIDKNKPAVNDRDDDKVLGQKYRAAKEAEQLLEGALQDISSYKTKRSSNKKFNKER